VTVGRPTPIRACAPLPTKSGAVIGNRRLVCHHQGVRHVVAREAHEIPDRPALQVAAGELVQLGERDDRWPAFVFVTTPHGAGWVPARHLSTPSDPPPGTAVVQIPYDTTELPTRVGDVLEVLTEDLLSGWLWCRADNGRQGWVPVAAVEDLADVS
jgi:Variant SH3 domain.